MSQTKIEIPEVKLADFCRRYQVKRLALFGSAVRGGFGPESDVDMLVLFESDARIGRVVAILNSGKDSSPGCFRAVNSMKARSLIRPPARIATYARRSTGGRLIPMQQYGCSMND